MRHMLNLFAVIAALASALTFTACGNNNSSSNTATPVPGIGPVGPNVALSSCQVGQVWAAGYGCLNRYSCAEGYGWVAGSNQCVQGTVVTSQMVYGGNVSITYLGQMQVTNQQVYKNLLTYSGMCGQNVSWVAYYWWASNCNNWMGASYFIIEGFSSVTGTVNMRIGASGSSWSTNGTGMEIQQSGVVSPAGSGFMIVGRDYMGRDVGLRAEATSGNLTTGYSFPVTLYFQGVAFATATMNRY